MKRLKPFRFLLLIGMSLTLMACQNKTELPSSSLGDSGTSQVSSLDKSTTSSTATSSSSLETILQTTTSKSPTHLTSQSLSTSTTSAKEQNEFTTTSSSIIETSSQDVSVINTGTTGTNTSSQESSTTLTEEYFNVNQLSGSEILSIKQAFPVFGTADDAMKNQNKAMDYESGTYYIYKIFDQAVNLSRQANQVGAWVNLNLIAKKNISVEGKSIQASSSTHNAAQLSTQIYNWSWGNPESSGKTLLESYAGLYRQYDAGNKIYLTFDNGYEYQNLTASILDTLKNNDVKAVFFVTGDYLNSETSLIRRMIDEGHIVANHSKWHKNHAKVSANEVEEDILGWESDYRNLFGTLPQIKLYRPPEGSFNEQSLAIAQKLGYKTILWSFAYRDWETSNQMSEKDALERLNNKLFSGSVILLHAVSNTNAEILDQFIHSARAKAYTFSLIN